MYHKLRDMQQFKKCGKLLHEYAKKESISDLNTPDIHWLFTMLGLPIPKDYYRPWNNEERQRLTLLEDEYDWLKHDHFEKANKLQKIGIERKETK